MMLARCASPLLVLCAGASALAADPSPAPPALPPVARRPGVVVDSIARSGLLLPSAQETASAVVLALNARYGAGFVVLADEIDNLKKLRRMTAGMPIAPDQEAGQRARMALLEWAGKEAPFRIKVTFKHDKKARAYVASAECRATGSTEVLHRVEGMGARYEAAVEALKPHLVTFCGVLDGLVAERKRGGTR